MKKIIGLLTLNTIFSSKNHRFTSSKFPDLYKELKTRDFYKNAVILRPNKASVNDLEMVHDRIYFKD